MIFEQTCLVLQGGLSSICSGDTDTTTSVQSAISHYSNSQVSKHKNILIRITARMFRSIPLDLFSITFEFSHFDVLDGSKLLLAKISKSSANSSSKFLPFEGSPVDSAMQLRYFLNEELHDGLTNCCEEGQKFVWQMTVSDLKFLQSIRAILGDRLLLGQGLL
uniref:Uncharacterized protein n=1 Tax=Romanomermis culicivorax TaxID=13658 RepID=A0A915IPH7_ROMCU